MRQDTQAGIAARTFVVTLIASFVVSGVAMDCPRETSAEAKNADAKVSELAAQLSSGDPERRIAAAKALGELGGRAEAAVPALIHVTRVSDDAIIGRMERSVAIDALVRIGRPALPYVARALEHENVNVRRSAGEVLAGMGRVAAPVGPALARMLVNDLDVRARWWAARALRFIAPEGKMGDVAIAAFIKALKQDKETRVRSIAAIALGDIGPGAKSAIPALVTALKDSDTTTRICAAAALGEMARGNDMAIAALRKAIEDNDSRVGENAINSLVRIGAVDRKLIDHLIGLLKGKRHDFVAARGLGVIGPPAKDSVPTLVAVMDDKERHGMVCCSATAALGKIGKNVETSLPALIRTLSGQSGTLQNKVLDALALLGPEAKPAVPRLVKCLESIPESSFSDDHRIKIASTLARIDPKVEAAVPHLITLLRNKEMQLAAISALGEIGPAAKAALPDLKRSFHNATASVRMDIIDTMARIGAPARELMPKLIVALSDTKSTGARSAAKIMARLGPAASAGLPILKKLAQQKTSYASVWAIYAIGAIERKPKVAAVRLAKRLKGEGSERKGVEALGPLQALGSAAQPAVPQLLEILGDHNVNIATRGYAATALGDIGLGPDAKAVVAALKKASQGRCKIVRHYAAESLVKILGSIRVSP